MNEKDFFTSNCKRCICIGCKDRDDTKFCVKHCTTCQQNNGLLNRKRCIFTPSYAK